MKLAVISDIHANLPALESVIKSIETKNIDGILCLGDIVGYGANPEECTRLIRSMDIPTVMGNHDQAAVETGNPDYFNDWALEAILWTRGQLSPDSHDFLCNLEYTRRFRDIFLTHASPKEPQFWSYIFTANQAYPVFRHFTETVCFFGHTHFPVIINGLEGDRRLINVGSVGQPRDNDPRACYGIYDDESLNFEWVRVEYDIEKAAALITGAGLPKFLAKRLFSGR